jgi:Icc-related predicted phosphoesterase
MKIDCIADLHGHYPKLEGGDLLIVAGDLTRSDESHEYSDFLRWLGDQKYTKKVVIAGNHDNLLAGPWPGGTKGPFREDRTFYDFDYLCDSGTEFEYEQQISHPASTKYISIDCLCYEKKKLKIWGSPWTKRFPGMNPKCMAFTVETEEELAEKWAMIPEDIDILVTHGPAFSYLDKTIDGNCVGSPSLRLRLRRLYLLGTRIKLHVHGHIHEAYGETGDAIVERRVNASHVNERYEPVNKPIRIIL